MKKIPNSRSGCSRRQFLQRGAVCAAGVMVVRSSVLGMGGATSPNEKLNLVGIGVGGQGSRDVSELSGENIVALCDVDHGRGAGMFRKFPSAKQYKDYRKMLDEVKDIDGVIVATPDHHHAFASMEAIKRGKHVYCEKPLTHSVWEARQVALAARKAKVATQMGNQGQASDETRRLCEWVWSEVIGPVREVHIWTDRPSKGLFDEYWPQGVGRPGDRPDVPKDLDWDLWLGPAPERPYHPAYVPFKWRGWWDFGTGALGDIGCHSMDPVFRALKLGAPTSVQAASTRTNGDSFPLSSMVTYEFDARGPEPQTHNVQVLGLSGAAAGGIAMPACKLVWYDGGLRPPRPDGLPDGRLMGDNGRLLIGDRGFILGNAVYPADCSKAAEQVATSIPRSAGHYTEWVTACKGGKPAGANFDWAGPLAEAVLLGNVALRTQLREDLTLTKLRWDPVQFKFTNLESANQYLRREYRQGWIL